MRSFIVSALGRGFLITLFFILMIFSCREQRTSVSGGEINAIGTSEEETSLNTNVVTKDDIASALRVWTRAKSSPFYEDSIDNIIYGKGRFVAAGRSRVTLAYSDDGDTWHTVQEDIFGTSKVYGMVYGNGRFVAAARGNKMAYSDDGETWILAENGGLGDYSIDGISYGAGCFVAVGHNHRQENGIIGYSKDGETWLLVEDGSLGIKYFNCITYGNGMFIIGGYDGDAAYSKDGKTWTVMPGSPFEDLTVNIITYGNGRFVAFGSYFQMSNPKTFYSNNGLNWAVVSDGPLNNFVYNIVYVNGIFIAVTASARMAYSFDGITWNSGYDGRGFIIDELSGPLSNLGGIAYGNGRLVIGGGAGISGSSRMAWCEVPVFIEDTTDTNLQEVQPQEDIHKTMYVAVPAGFQVKNTPNIDSDTIGLLDLGAEVVLTNRESNVVTIDGIHGKWVNIILPVEGWVFSEFLADTSEKARLASSVYEQARLAHYTSELDKGGGIVIKNYTGTDKVIIIPAHINGVPVTSIGANAFNEKKLTNVTIPNSVKNIENGAFRNNKLVNIILPGGLETIGNSAFEENELISIIIPDNVTSIGNNAFFKNKLINVIFGKNLRGIGASAFAGNKWSSNNLPSYNGNELTSLTIPDSVTNIGDYAFSANQLKSVTLGNSVSSIGRDAFEYNKFERLVIPDSITAIGRDAFNYYVTSITIGANLTIGGDWLNNGFFGFKEAYINGGNLAGTYTRPNTNSKIWTRQ